MKHAKKYQKIKKHFREFHSIDSVGICHVGYYEILGTFGDGVSLQNMCQHRCVHGQLFREDLAALIRTLIGHGFIY